VLLPSRNSSTARPSNSKTRSNALSVASNTGFTSNTVKQVQLHFRSLHQVSAVDMGTTPYRFIFHGSTICQNLFDCPVTGLLKPRLKPWLSGCCARQTCACPVMLRYEMPWFSRNPSKMKDSTFKKGVRQQPQLLTRPFLNNRLKPQQIKKSALPVPESVATWIQCIIWNITKVQQRVTFIFLHNTVSSGHAHLKQIGIRLDDTTAQTKAAASKTYFDIWSDLAITLWPTDLAW